MELVVDLERVTVVLADAADTSDVSVRVSAPSGASPGSQGDVHRLHDVLVAAYVGRLDGPRDAVVRADAIRFHAAGQVDAAWEERFGRLCVDRAAPPEVLQSDAVIDAEGAAGPSLRAPVWWPEDPGRAPAAEPLGPGSLSP